VNESREYFPARTLRHCWRSVQFFRTSIAGTVSVWGHCLLTGLSPGTHVAAGSDFSDGRGGIVCLRALTASANRASRAFFRNRAAATIMITSAMTMRSMISSMPVMNCAI
jgi:hypothetical protein